MPSGPSTAHTQLSARPQTVGVLQRAPRRVKALDAGKDVNRNPRMHPPRQESGQILQPEEPLISLLNREDAQDHESFRIFSWS